MAKGSRKPKPVNQLISLPIFWQVLGLSLVVLVLALGINTLIVLKAPEPPPSGYSLREVVSAFKTGSARLQNGHLLRAETTSDEPAYVTQNPSHEGREWRFESELAERLAGELGVPANTVWVKFSQRSFRGAWGRQFPGGGRPPGRGGDLDPDRQIPDATPPVTAPAADNASSPAGPGDQANDAAGPAPGPGPAAGPDGPNQSPTVDPRPYAFEPRVPARLRFPGSDSRTDIFYPAFSAAWKQADGTYKVIAPPEIFIQPWQERLLLGFGLTALVILPLAWLLSRRLTRPIIAFSEAAARIGVEDSAAPLVPSGSREVRAAADVLNAMQARIKKQVENRTALMGAIAHDLKTPLARMRLRIEDLPNPLRDKLSQDIAHMDGLVRSAMSFTSAHKLAESLRPLDLSALAEALSEDMAAVCPMDEPRITPNIMVKGDAVALKRILTNLIENACRYAGSCRVDLTAQGDRVEIDIVDNGPGLPPDALEAVFEPFYRLEESRNRDTGGTGLGLSVAKSLAEAQGGTLTLSNRTEGGLEAKLSLPRLTMK